MKRARIFLMIIGFFYAGLCSLAQDIHFSQFYSTPMQTNPANAGNFDGDFRAVLNNKNQWNSFTNAYRTFAGSADYSHNNLFMDGDVSGVGILLNRDVAGDGNFGTTQVLLNSAYYYPLLSGKLKIALGIGLGFAHHGINLNDLNFGSQYFGDSYDENMDSGEEWVNSSFGYFDCSLGFNSILKIKPHYVLSAGLSAFHLNTPKKSFFGNTGSFLPVKWIVNLSLDYNFEKKLWLSPMFYFMSQQKYLEFDIGAMLKYDYNPLTLQSILFGIFARTKDAGIICAGVQYRNVRIMINYDINLSKLSKISRGNGGVEFSIIYIFLKAKPCEVPYYRKCPDFM